MDMTVDELIAQGERLARPCIFLSTAGEGEVVGYWGGERADHPNSVPAEATAIRSVRHIVTIDGGLLSRVGIDDRANSLGLQYVEPHKGDGGTRALWSGTPFRALECDGLPLFATPGMSFPPFEAVCLYGDGCVAAWLDSLGLARHQYIEAAGELPASEYIDVHTARSPLARQDVDAVVGGWHEPWPDDDFYLPLEMRLALLTLRDAEPWCEMWQAAGHRNWSVRERIT